MTTLHVQLTTLNETLLSVEHHTVIMKLDSKPTTINVRERLEKNGYNSFKILKMNQYTTDVIKVL